MNRIPRDEDDAPPRNRISRRQPRATEPEGVMGVASCISSFLPSPPAGAGRLEVANTRHLREIGEATPSTAALTTSNTLSRRRITAQHRLIAEQQRPKAKFAPAWIIERPGASNWVTEDNAFAPVGRRAGRDDATGWPMHANARGVPTLLQYTPSAVSVNGDRGGQHVRAAIVGTGFSGLGMAIRLKQSGIDDFIVLERADGLGGTWRDNHYPGLCCDIPSHVYSFSFELNRHWTRGFAPGPEILAYLRNAAQKYGVLPHVRFGHELARAEWDEQTARWEIETEAGRFTAGVLVSAAGPLSDATIPNIPGLAEFEGKMFHSADWDHAHDLTGQRVAVIGTGASAIQFVPQIQPQVERLYLFQRTPPWVIPRLDHEITRPEHFLLRWIPFAEAIVRAVLYWLLEVRVVGFRRPRLMKLVNGLARWHLLRQVPDPQLREKLTPDYTIGCKRILISDNYYPALNEPNVEVLTTGVEELRKRSIVTDGRELEVDTVIFGTGFHVTDPPIAERIHGRDGRSLAETWNSSMQAYLGTAVAGFPNLFLILGPNTGLGHNSMIYMVESQVSYILDCLRVMRERGAELVEVRRETQDSYNAELQGSMEGTVWTAGHCQSWYLDATGRNTTLWPGWTFDFRRRTRRFDPDRYVLESRTERVPVR